MKLTFISGCIRVCSHDKQDRDKTPTSSEDFHQNGHSQSSGSHRGSPVSQGSQVSQWYTRCLAALGWRQMWMVFAVLGMGDVMVSFSKFLCCLRAPSISVML